MPKRIYSARNKRIFQYRQGGNFYMKIGSSEVCLDTSVEDLALEHLEFQDARTSRFGAQSYSFKIKQLFPEFLSDKRKDLRPRTLALYSSIWERYFKGFYGPKPLAEINQRTWDAFVEKFDSVSDFQNHRNLMHQFQVWCEGKGYLLAITTLKNPKHKRRKRKVIPKEHLALIFQQANDNLLLFSSLALFMGMRRAEILTLEWSRVDLKRNAILLRDIDTKTDDGREIPINQTARSLLLKREGSGRWVFPNASTPKRHMSLEGLMGSWRRALLRAGLAVKLASPGTKVGSKIVVQYTWHDFRATYEKYSHLSKDHTDTQKEKMVGADMSVQKRIYVNMDADDLRGLEQVVSDQVPALSEVIGRKNSSGKTAGSRKLKNADMAVSRE